MRAIKNLLIFAEVAVTMHVKQLSCKKICVHRQQTRSKVKSTQTAYQQFLLIFKFSERAEKRHSLSTCLRTNSRLKPTETLINKCVSDPDGAGVPRLK